MKYYRGQTRFQGSGNQLKRIGCAGPNAKAGFVENPKAACGRFARQEVGESHDGATNHRKRLVVQSQDDDAGSIGRVVPADIGEVQIQRHHDAALSFGSDQQRVVGGAGETLLAGCRDIMAGGLQQLPRHIGQVFVELKRRQESEGTGTIRSRAKSAA